MYKLLLILKYLRRRRIAWVSLVAVTLCTAMVIVVISVMGGWLKMYENNARGMTGDLVVKGGLSGFAHYDEMVERVEKLPFIEAAVPQIKTMGVVTLGQTVYDRVARREVELGKKTEGVEVYGVQIDRIGRVNTWPQSLYQQHTRYDEPEFKGTPPATKTFDVPRTVSVLVDVPAEELPAALQPEFHNLARAGQKLSQWLPPAAGAEVAGRIAVLGGDVGPEWENIRFDPRTKELATDRPMPASQRRALAAHGQGMEHGKAWESAILRLASLSNQRGLIAGSRLLEVSRNKYGEITGRKEFKYTALWAKLTVAGVSETEKISLDTRAERSYWVVDDSRTGMWQYDSKAVYVPFNQLQQDLGMEAREVELAGSGEKVWAPARTTEIQIKCRPGTDLEAAKDEVAAIVFGVMEAHRKDKYPAATSGPPRVETWRQASETYLAAIEKEKSLMAFLFAIISVVAVFLIFCIFYMIVAEKTKDIGIIKSVGATNGGVAAIFLGYGLAIGIVGAGLGLLMAHLVVSNINEIHDWLGVTFQLVVWNPEVYAFDTIPNTMDPTAVEIILGVAVLSSVLGALVPAVRAARMQPVEALRWE